MDEETTETSLLFLGLPQDTVMDMFGLKTYCDVYGRMNEKVELTADHEEFDVWHANVHFAHA